MTGQMSCIELSNDQKSELPKFIEHYDRWFGDNIATPVAKSLGLLPKVVLKHRAILKETKHRVSRDVIISEDLPTLRRVVAHERRTLAEMNEERFMKTSNSEIRDQLREPMDRLLDMMSASWFEGPMLEVPRVTQFLTIKEAYSRLESKLTPPAPEYDEKFGLLLAPGQFLPRLTIARREAALRNTTTGVSFIDIDNFKRFNTRHREDKVDLHVLPKFMSTLEAHLHCHGHAFRFGGDEYMVLLPNTRPELALAFLRHLQEKVATLEFLDPLDKMTVSIGLTTFSSQSLLTDRELQERSTKLKNRAKTEGKDRIAWADGDSLKLGDVKVAER
ncbi:MAG: GGDEF domain-containing protein [Pseudomonadota bacterium]